MPPASPPPANRTERFIDGLLRARGWLVVLLAMLTLASLWGLRDIGVDNAVEIWFVEGDPALAAYAEFQDTFGNDEVAILALHDEHSLLNQAGMARIAAVSAAAAGVPGVGRVTSLSTVSQIRSGDDWLEVAPLSQRPLPGDFAARVQADPLLQGRLVSADGKTALVLAWMAPMENIDAQRDAVLGELKQAVGATGEPVHYGGIGVVYQAMNQASTVDTRVFILASCGVIVCLLLLLFRHVGPVLLTLGVVGLAAVWIMGLYGALGHDINMVTMIVPSLMLIIGVSDCVHFLSRAVELPAEGSRWARVRAAVAFMFWPCLMNSLTTAAGFASLATARMPVVRDLGVFSAVGVLGAFLAAVVGCSVGLLWRRMEPSPAPPKALSWVVERMAALATERPAAVLVGALAVVLAAALGITRLEVDTYSIDYLRAAHPVRQDSAAIEAEFGPYMPLEMVVHAPDALHDPVLLTAVAAWQDAMQADPRVGWTSSAADVVRRLNQVLSDGRPESYRVPTNPAALEQALLLYQADPDADLSSLVSADGDQLRVTVGIPMASAKGIGQVLRDLTALAALPPGATLQPAGYLPLYVRIMDEVVSSQIASFTLAFLVVFAMLAVLFRSFRLAALAIPPNLVPVVVILGTMGLVGIRLDVATVTVSAVMLGLIVDDTTQLLYRFRHELGRLGEHSAAVRATIAGVGRPVLSTSVVLAAGFLVLGMAQIRSVAWFGLLMSMAMIWALLGDLLVLPAMLVLFRPRVRGA